jgi:hypothetical protein
MSGETGKVVQMVAGAVMGAVASRFVDNIIKKQTTITIDDKILQIIKAGAGVFAAVKMKQPFLQGLGIGVASQAAVAELTDMGVLTGIGRVDPRSLKFPPRQVAGPGASQTVYPSVGQPVNAQAVGRAMYAGVYD